MTSAAKELVKLEWSPFQEAIFKEVKNTNNNIVIKAVAGSAKTTTLIECSRLIPRYNKVLFSAFNKSIALELKEKLPSHIFCSNLHSIGMGMLYKRYGSSIKLDEYKTVNFTNKFIAKWNLTVKSKDSYKFNIAKIIDLIRMNDVEIYQKEDIIELIDYYDLYREKDTILHVIQTWEALNKYNNTLYNEKVKKIDFTDMLRIPLNEKGFVFEKYDTVFVDEVQDLNKLQQRFIEQFMSKTGRFIMAGDAGQSIYSFMGADANSFYNFESKKNTVALPLSISYRCNQAIVREAQLIMPEIQPWNKSPEGEVRNGNIFEIREGDWVLCRNNKPLFVLCFELIKLKKKVKIRDNDLMKSLLLMINSVKSKRDYEAVFEHLDNVLEKTKQELEEKGVIRLNKHPKVKNMIEKIQIIGILSKHYDSISIMHRELHNIFTDKKTNDILLSTVHKSKGLENDRVFILQPELLNEGYMAEKAWEFNQQKCLKYVAITRAKKSLIFITEEKFKE